MMPPRSAFKRIKPKRAGRPEWKRAEDYGHFLRGLPCACLGKNDWCDGPTEAAHVDHAGKGTRDAKGLGSKVADRFMLPLSRECHRRQTEVLAWPEFQKLLPLKDAEALSGIYWTEFLATPKGREWQRQAAERGESTSAAA
jgi:hypothetical protein